MSTSVPTFSIKNISDPSISDIFSKELDVFGLKIFATSGTSDEDIIHAGKIYAEYLDNNRDGTIDDVLVVEKMIESKAVIGMTKDQNETDSLDFSSLSEAGYQVQDLNGVETIQNSSELNKFDATLEEVLHLITDYGYGLAYPEAFASNAFQGNFSITNSSLLTEAMDTARGGKFLTIPASYPTSAWYTFYDETADYSTQASEYFYWGLTSILGAQSFPGRYDEIKSEWKLNTSEKVQETDSKLYNLLTDSKYSLPTILPDGNYSVISNSKTYSGAFNEYTFINQGNDKYGIKLDISSTIDSLTGLSSLNFSDKSIDINKDIIGTFNQVTGKDDVTGRMFRLYNAAFARFPDADGLKYWIEKNASGENSNRVVAQSFLASAEFAERYGSDVTNEKYVETLYVNVLGRNSDIAGYNYWVGNLNNGIETRYEALLGFAESAENKALFTDMTGFD
tara:strand:- start:96 stop:1451 length:1356 start_codon:yes stop_codon:yes gene_type:complete